MEIFPHVYGQNRLKQNISQLFRENRLPHTLIFYGDEGLGKTTAALDLSGAITGCNLYTEAMGWFADSNAEKYPVLTGASDQVWYIRPLGLELKLEQFRLFLDAMIEFDERPHVCIIDEAQTMMPAIANAMLKTLEEPLSQVYFILITHDLAALLPTIISRGERFAFSPLSEEDYGALLKARPEDFPLPGLDVRQAFILSEGNPGLTMEMFSSEGIPQPESAIHVWECITESRQPFADGMSAAEEDRKELRRMLRWLMLIGRDLLVLSDTADKEMVRCRQVLQRELYLAAKWDSRQTERALTVLKEADLAAKRYISVKNIWDMILISLVRIQKGTY